MHYGTSPNTTRSRRSHINVKPVNDRLLRALRRQPVDRTPVWIMRQAGRYLPEYRAARERAGDFLTLCQTPELACEVTLQPLARFALDAAILFSDILTIPAAMGLGLHFRAGEGPQFEHPLRDAAAIRALTAPDPHTELRYVMDALRLIRRELDGRVPLIGFAGSPWTLATYMVEGGASRNFPHIKRLIYDEPELADQLLATLARASADYLNAQAEAGAQVLQIFDTWGGVLTGEAFRRFSLAPMRSIVRSLRAGAAGDDTPVIVFTKGGGHWLEDIADIGCDALGLDWSQDIGAARRRVGERAALQGNLDPSILYAQPARIREQIATVLAGFGPGSGHVFNLGHGVTPDIEPEHVAAMVDAVTELSPAYHR